MKSTQRKPKNLAAEIGRDRPFDSLEQELFLNLIRTSEWLQGEFATVFKAHGITQPQFNVLKILQVEEEFGIPIQKIGARMTTKSSDVTRLVDRLERSGMVKRFRTEEDRRIIYVRLTEAGRAMIDQLAQPLIEAHQSTKGNFDRTSLELLNNLLFELRHSRD
ncbi:MAG: MarR family transcriptional regulator [Deltaproteobacteria bacterium]|nr:MarR family transcriptional regulator [Deltaproteobacteria bacterium]